MIALNWKPVANSTDDGALAPFRGLISPSAIFLAVVLGHLLALALGEVDTSAIASAAWPGLPHFQTPRFNLAMLPMFLPAVIALVAPNIGHVKSVGQMTGVDTDPLTGRALAADGVATVLAGMRLLGILRGRRAGGPRLTDWRLGGVLRGGGGG